MEDRLVTRNECRAFGLNVSNTQFQRYEKQGLLTPIKIGVDVTLCSSALLAFGGYELNRPQAPYEATSDPASLEIYGPHCCNGGGRLHFPLPRNCWRIRCDYRTCYPVVTVPCAKYRDTGPFPHNCRVALAATPYPHSSPIRPQAAPMSDRRRQATHSPQARLG